MEQKTIALAMMLMSIYVTTIDILFVHHHILASVHKKKHEANSQILYLYAKAHYQTMRGLSAHAAKTYAELLKLNPPFHIYEGYVKFLFDAQKFSELLALADDIWNRFSDNVEMQLCKAQALLITDQEKKADELLTPLLVKNPRNEQVAYYATLTSLKGNDTDKALKIIDTFLANVTESAKHALFYFLKSKIYLQTGKHQEALAAIEKSLELYPNFDKGLLFKSVLLEQAGKVTEAISGYRRFLEVSPGDALIEKQLIHLLFTQNRFSEASDQLRKMKSDAPNYYFDLALLEWRAGNLGEAEKTIAIAVKKDPNFLQSKLLNVEILLAQGKKKEIEAFMEHWLMHQSDKKPALQTLLILRKGHLELDVIIALLERCEKHHDDRAFVTALADLYCEKKDYAHSVTYYNKLLTKLAPTENELKSKIFFHLGYVHFLNKEIKSTEAMLKKSIEIEPKFAEAYNLLAYHYAEQDTTKLPTALTLIDKAIEQKPTCSHYIDTKGWILLKQGKCAQAIELFEQALKLASSDTIIQDHLKMAQQTID